MAITLTQFEAIDAELSTLLHMGEFSTCADPRGYIATSNRMFDKCIYAMGYAWCDDFASPEECAAAIVTMALLDRTFVTDEVEG